jgi:hypothetical protein
LKETKIKETNMDALQIVNRLDSSKKHHVPLLSKSSQPNKMKAKLLLDKEETNTKKSRLECLLSQQYIAKYGSKQPNSQLNNQIKSLIHAKLVKTDNFQSPRFLTQLENDISDFSEEYKQQVIEQKQSARLSSRHNSLPSSSISADPQSSSSLSSSSTLVNPNQWSVLNTIQLVNADEEARKVKQQSQLKKLQFRHELDEQLESMQRLKEKEKQEKLKLKQETEKLNHEVEQEKERVKRSQYLRHQQDRELIRYQIEERKLTKEMEREESIRQDQQEMRRAQERAAEEEELKLQKKLREKEQQELLRLENERVKEKKRYDQLRQYEEEKRLEEEYRYPSPPYGLISPHLFIRQKLDREDKLRNDAFSKRMNAMKKFSEKYEREGAGAMEQEQRRKEEAKLSEEILLKNREEEMKRVAKSELMKRRIKETSEENLRLIQEKEREKSRREQENRELRERYQREYEESREEEKKKQERKRLTAMEMKAQLDRQIDDKGGSLSSGMRNQLSQREVELNKSLLKKIEDDKEFQMEVYRRLNPEAAGMMGAGATQRQGSGGRRGQSVGAAGGSRQKRTPGGNIF